MYNIGILLPCVVRCPLSSRPIISKRYHPMALSLALHAGLLMALAISFHQPGLSNGTAPSITSITMVSADSLPDMALLPRLDGQETSDAAAPFPAVAAAAQSAGETALMLQTLTGMADMLAQHAQTMSQAASASAAGGVAVPPMQTASPQTEPTLLAQASPIVLNDDEVAARARRKEQAAGASIVITITLGSMEGAIEHYPIPADGRWAETTVSVLQ